MFCSNCGAQNADGAKFCRQCGSPLHSAMSNEYGSNDKKNNKTIFIVIGAVVIVIALVGALFFGMRGKKAKEYETYLASADKYVEELNYEQAKDFYLKAISVEPKQLEPYVRLAHVYVELDELGKAEEILNKAEENDAEGSVEITREYEELRSLISNPVEQSVGSLEYEMREENLEYTTSTGVLVYKNTIKYPFFFGESEAEKNLNQNYQDIINEYKTTMSNPDGYYADIIEWDQVDTLPHYDDVITEVTYNKNGFISIFEVYTMWSGGMHPYNEEGGITMRIEDGKKLTSTDIVQGTEEQRLTLAKYYIEKEGFDSDSYDYLLDYFYESSYTLTEQGACFYLWMGDAVAPLEITIPYSDEDTCIISAEKALQQAGYTVENTTEDDNRNAGNETPIWETELAQTEEKSEVLEVQLDNAMAQSDINKYSYQLYQLWDDEINQLWAHLKENLSKSEMDALTVKQREWIKEKEAEIEAAGKEWEGGSGQPMAENIAGWTMTEERVYELIEYLR